MTRFVFVTGGVVSSLGKGIAAASLGAILESRGLKVAMVKLDPYINVDPGTMSPYQHGEVYVLDDGAETDLDLGHYERFTSGPLTRRSPGASSRRAGGPSARRRPWSSKIQLPESTWKRGGSPARSAAPVKRPSGMNK